MAATLKFRSPEDVSRLFSALSDVQLTHEEYGMSSLSELELAALEDVEGFELFDQGALRGLVLTGLIGLIASWVAIKGYERNEGSVGKGVLWGTAGVLLPLPALVYTTLSD